MQQLDLLTIRKQPNQPAPRIASKTIKAYVAANLQGFATRQKERERERAAAQLRESPRKPPRPKAERPNMKSITITYRASFRQPIGLLNPLHCKLPGPCPIEVFKTGSKWFAREPAYRRVYEKLPAAANAESAREMVQQNFQEQLEPWQIWGTPPAASHSEKGEPRPLEPGVDICDLGDDQWGLLTPNDFTHIIHAPTVPAGARIPPAACGATVDTKKFISTRANIEPTCRTCAEIYRQEYANK